MAVHARRVRGSQISRNVQSRGLAAFGVSGGTGRNLGPSAAPAISALSSGTPNANDATITWTTDIASDSQVFWGLTAAYGGATSPIMQAAFVTSHSVQITGLTTATTYHYKVLSRNANGGGYSFSADNTFVTA